MNHCLNLTFFIVFSLAGGITTIAQIKDSAKKVRGSLKPEYHVFLGPSYLFPSAAYRWPSERRLKRFGFTAGIASNYRLNGPLELEGSLSYDRKGMRKSRQLGPGLKIIEDAINDYMTFNLAPVVVFPSRRLKAGIAGYVSYLIRSQVKITYDTAQVARYAYVKDASAYHQRLDAGVTVTVHYRVPMFESEKLYLRLFASFGLLPVSKPVGQTALIASAHHNNSVALCVEFRLD